MRYVATIALLALGCGGAPPNATPQPVTPQQSTTIPAAALGARLFADGYEEAIDVDEAGRVTHLQTRSGPQDQAAVQRIFGDAFGYGRLGAGVTQPATDPNRVTLVFENAEGCPGLVVGITAGSEDLICPTAPGATARLARLRDPVAVVVKPDFVSPPAPPPDPPVVAWLKSQGYALNKVTFPVSKGTMKIELASKLVPAGTTRRAFAARIAADIAKAAGFSGLDRVTELDVPLKYTKVPHLFATLDLRMKSPPLDGVCIDPSVLVGVATGDQGGDSNDRNFWLAEVDVSCEHEPTDGPKPPSDTARTLPKTAQGQAAYLAMCRRVGPGMFGDVSAWGWLLDKKGDIYTTTGIEPVTTPHDLAVVARQDRRFVGSFSAAEADRFAALSRTAGAERRARHQRIADDFRYTKCEVFNSTNATDLAIVPINAPDMPNYDNDPGPGPIGAELATLLGHVNTLVERGRP